MRLIIITGMSGAGKSIALRTLEDGGFEAIDNLPLKFLPLIATSEENSRDMAIDIDVRNRNFSSDSFLHMISEVRANPNIDLKLLFLDCDAEMLLRRFSETRRKHPLAEDRPVADGITLERECLAEIKRSADKVIDTSSTLSSELRALLMAEFLEERRTLQIMLTSFSYKHGVPREADMVLDVRFLQNPHYIEALQPLTGKEQQVADYVQADSGYEEFWQNLNQLLAPLLPRYLEEGKHYFTLAIGCTGGKHRSVAVVEALGKWLKEQGYGPRIRHRELG